MQLGANPVDAGLLFCQFVQFAEARAALAHADLSVNSIFWRKHLHSNVDEKGECFSSDVSEKSVRTPNSADTGKYRNVQ